MAPVETILIPGGGIRVNDSLVPGAHVASHIGRTDAELAQRLRDRPRLNTVSSFRNYQEAEFALNAALRAGQARINDWIANGMPGGSLRVDVVLPGATIGSVMARGTTSSVSGNTVTLILHSTPTGNLHPQSPFAIYTTSISVTPLTPPPPP